MPPRRRVYRKNNKKRVNRRAPRRKGFGPMGGFRVVRNIPLVCAKGTTTVGAITSTSTDTLAVGTPVASPTGITNMYDVPFSLFFKLEEVQDYTDITQFADKYKITTASIIAHGSNATSPYGGACSYIQYVVDTDDIVVPTIAQFDQKMGVKNKVFNQTGMVKMYAKLRTNTSVYDQSQTNSTLPAGIVSSRSVWLNSAYPTVPHFGIKGIIRNMYLGGSVSTMSQVAFNIKLTILGADLQ